jgi:hypothetical protein
MKNLLRVLALSALTLVFVAAPQAPTFAQDATAARTQERDALYTEKFLKNYKGSEDQQRIAYDAAKEYLQKYSGDEDNADIKKFLQNWMPKYEAYLKQKAQAETYGVLDAAYKAQDWRKYFDTGKRILASEPDNLNLLMYLVNNGYQLSNSKTPNDTYNNEVIALAKQAIQRIEGGATAAKWEPYADKNAALAWLNYTIGFMLFKQNGMEKDAAPYFYKSTQFQSVIKNDPNPYRNIGYWYSQEYTKVANEYKSKCVDTTCDDATAKGLLGNLKGVADRVLDSYARALKVARDQKSPLATELTKTAQAAYKARFDSETGLDAYLNSIMSKPMPDPTSTITPVETTTTTTTTSTGTSGTTPATSSAAMTTAKPTTSPTASTGTTNTRPRTTDAANSTDTTTTTAKPTTTTKPAAAKPAPKKPGRKTK